jgi:hypothetical protein
MIQLIPIAMLSKKSGSLGLGALMGLRLTEKRVVGLLVEEEPVVVHLGHLLQILQLVLPVPHHAAH